MLPLVNTARPSSRTGSDSASFRRPAITRAVAASGQSSHRIVNSSSPSRATVSAVRSVSAQAPRDLDEQPVAGVVAEAVVDELEAVEVDAEHGQGLVAATRAPSPAARRRTRGWPAR